MTTGRCYLKFHVVCLRLSDIDVLRSLFTSASAALVQCIDSLIYHYVTCCDNVYEDKGVKLALGLMMMSINTHMKVNK